jgi:hypothetical protein
VIECKRETARERCLANMHSVCTWSKFWEPPVTHYGADSIPNVNWVSMDSETRTLLFCLELFFLEGGPLSVEAEIHTCSYNLTVSHIFTVEF